MGIEAERIQKAIDAIKEERPGYGQILDLLGKIMVKQSESSDKIKVKSKTISKDAARAKLRKGTPLLSRWDFQVDLTSASRLFEELCEVLKMREIPHTPEESEDQELSDEIGRIEEALESEDLILEEVFESVLRSGRRISELAELLSLDGEILFMLAAASVRPSVEFIASQANDMVEEALWSECYCPVCGSSPAISELRRMSPGGLEGTTAEGAERILYCSFCGTEWRAMRLACAFCGNTDTDFLKYIYAEGDEGYRIDVCDKCKKYIKTVDSREIRHEVVLPVEDIGTLHLDIIAEDEGYKREAWLMGKIPHTP